MSGCAILSDVILGSTKADVTVIAGYGTVDNSDAPNEDMSFIVKNNDQIGTMKRALLVTYNRIIRRCVEVTDHED